MPAAPASSSPPVECDVLVVGAGIVGLAVARELAQRHPGIRVAVLEREPGIARHQTASASGVIHAGIYYAPGSLRARLCVEGAAELYSYCAERGIPTDRTGKLIVATRPSELARLDELECRGRANGVPGLRRVGASEIAAIEPHARGIAALHSPATGVVDFAAVAAAFAADLTAAGGTLSTGCEVLGMREAGGAVAVEHRHGLTRARAAITCAGAWSDRLAVTAGADPEPRIVPFRGVYLRLRPDRARLVRASIYPVPDPRLPFLGAHLTHGIDGTVLFGPTALLAATDIGRTLAWPGTWRLAARHWRAGATEIVHALSRRSLVAQARRLVPALEAADFERGPSGVRAQAVARDGALVDDFAVSRTGRVLHVRNAPSPAATSSLPLARLIADRAEAELGIGH